MSDEFLPHIANFKKLTHLDLSSPDKSLSTEAVVELLCAVGSRLTRLNLSQNPDLTDEIFSQALTTHARSLTTLIMNGMESLSDAGVASFFESTENPAILDISFRRNHCLSDLALAALLKHSGPLLERLDINQWKDVSNEVLLTIGTSAPQLQSIDLGFCRNVDDFVVKSILEGCP